MLDSLLCALKKFFYWALNELTDLLNFLIGPLLNLLPNTPFEFEPVQWGEFGNAIGYFIPIDKMLTHFTLLLMAIVVYYAISHLLRFVKMVK